MDPELPASPGRAPVSGRPAGTPAPPAWLGRLLARASVDLAPRHRQPASVRVVVATVVALAGSVGLDELIVHGATALFPLTAHFSHFRLADYASLTVVGVLGACAAWPLTTRVSSRPRPLFFRAAVALTVVLWLPDGWLLLKGERAQAVGALMLMHLAIALVTYNALVRLAPVRPAPVQPAPARPATGQAAGAVALEEGSVRRLWSAMAALVALELALGVATIVAVPFRRPNAILPSKATWLYAAHGGVGVVLGVGALGVLVLSLLAGRMARIGAVLGGTGVVAGLAGGVMATYQVTRLLGMGVMMLGALVAGIGYLVPALEAMGKAEAAKALAARQAMAARDAHRENGSASGQVGGDSRRGSERA